MNAASPWWRQLVGANSRRHQIAIAIGLSLVLFLLLLGGYWLLRPKYRVVSHGLKPQDVAAVVAELEKEKIPYRLDEDGTTVLVPGDAAQAATVKMADLQLRGLVGLELFQDSDLGLTEFAQKVNYQRALQGEIARTLMSLDGVQLARVHLTLPDASIFRRDQTRPKASVTIFPSSGTALGSAAIQGIGYLVAASVPGMAPADVIVLDQHGAAAIAHAASSSIENPRFALQQAVENAYEKKIHEQLIHVLGEDGASVSVSADLNFDQVHTTRENGRSTAVVSSATRNPLPTISTTGIADPLPPLPEISTAPAQTQHVLEQVTSAPGSIRRLSVSIVLDRAQPTAVMDTVEAVAAAAVGIDRSRGDSISTAVKANAAVAPVEPISNSVPRPLAVPSPATPDKATNGLGGISRMEAMRIAGIIVALLLACTLLMSRKQAHARQPLSAQEREAFASRLRSLLDNRKSSDVPFE